ncbi:MAG: pyruvate kinase, partial [Candidatus Saccharimonadales bacterium]
MQKKTKIIATIGPVSESEEMLEKLMRAGADCFRLNFSHGDHREHGTRITRIRKLAKRMGRHAAIIADMQGPKMRIGKLPDDGIILKEGERIVLDCSKSTYENGIIPLPSPVFAAGAKEGSTVYLDDGTLIIKIARKTGKRFEAVVEKGGVLFSKKGTNVPSLQIKGSILSEKDKADITFAAGASVDYIALSFLRTAEDVREARKYIKNPHIKIIAKIERPEALEHLDGIIDASDAIMVARGDLGIETPLWELPIRQKEIVERVRRKFKPVIVATQMLDSMIRNPLPTRAEVSDVANAVYDSADAVMLSGESAQGRYPLEAVEMMSKVLESTEHTQLRHFHQPPDQKSLFLSVAKSAADISFELKTKVIFVETFSGESA